MSDLHAQITNIVSFDGAGIYGLTQALWIKWLTQAEGSFLNWEGKAGECSQMFAGTSSGAVNALLLARHPYPRNYADEVVSFWYAPGTWQNRCFPSSITSLMGLTAWYGTSDYKSLLYQYFGERRMRDLAFPVMVTVYDFSDVEHENSPERRWRPLQLTNFPVPADESGWLDVSDMLVAEVAYRCTAVPSLRAIEGGWADGGFASADPAVQAILAGGGYTDWAGSATSSAFAAKSKAKEDGARPPVRSLSEILRSLVHGDRTFEPDPEDGLAADGFSMPLPTLTDLKMLSVGDGGPVSWYWQPDYNWGPAWNLLPVNPMQRPQGLYPPTTYTYLSPTNELITELASGLLRENHFFRLNPAITSMPVSSTIYIARSEFWRQWLLRSVEQGVCSPQSIEALNRTRAFISGSIWLGT